jgi:hypothetical protein
MRIFSKKQKQLALTTPKRDLQAKFEQSEDLLKQACFAGRDKFIKAEMKNHKLYEYAMLYQNTPQYAKKISKHSRK